MAPSAPSTLAPTITDDLSVAPLDGRLTDNARYEEEIDLQIRRDGRIMAGSTGSSTCSVWPFREDDDDLL